MVPILVFTTLTSSAVAHVSDQKRYNDGYITGQDYAACDYISCDGSNHGYDTGCPNDKKHTPMNSAMGIHLAIRPNGIH